MKFAQLDSEGLPLIEAYGPDGVRVGGRDYPGGLLLSVAGVVADWGPTSVAGLRLAHFTTVLDAAATAPGHTGPGAGGPTMPASPQVLIIGTGARQRFPDPALLAALVNRGIGVEVMDTGAACRTYNILVGEGRQVVAAFVGEGHGS